MSIDTDKAFLGVDIVSDEGRLAFQNPKSGSEVIHLVNPSGDEVTPSDVMRYPHNGRYHVGYGWSECGQGASRIDVDEAIYVDDDNESGYIERDGEIIGKLCKQCAP